MIKGLGNDIIEISRIEGVISRNGSHFLNRIYTKAEQDYCLKYKESVRHFAGRFAAKEAIVKAMGTGFGQEASWKDIEILNDKNGKPHVILSSKLKEQYKNSQIQISISHCKKFATAVAIIT